MPKTKSRGFTLIELILVVSMLLILAVIGTNSYSKSKNKSISREAIANLKLIAAAERIYKMESTSNSYAPCTTGPNCNLLLKLNLNENNWGYKVDAVAGSGTTADATVTATLQTDSNCKYTLDALTGGFDADPSGSGCPSGMN
jgi:prepilin-type N-terminal cleavage/methylation domain-containing protein